MMMASSGSPAADAQGQRWPQGAGGSFHIDLPALRVPDVSLRMPEFDLPRLELLGPAWAQLRARFHQQEHQRVLPEMPDVVTEGYEPRGVWKQLGDWRVYVVGPDPSLDCIVAATDIHGPTLQSIQGADLLAHLSSATVYLPDFFAGRPYPLARYPPQDPHEQAELRRFLDDRAGFDDCRDALVAFGEALRNRFRRREGARGGGDGTDDEDERAGPDARDEGEQRDWEQWVRVGCYGTSWGGKLAFLAGSGAHPFYAVAALTPAMMTILDAEALKVPLGLFLSRDEPADVGARIVDLLRWKTFSAKCEVRTWDDMPHGFPAALGDLRDPAVAAAYKDVHAALARFFLAAQQGDAVQSPAAAAAGSAGAEQAAAGREGRVHAVEQDVGRRDVREGETVRNRVREEEREKKGGKRGWFARRFKG